VHSVACTHGGRVHTSSRSLLLSGTLSTEPLLAKCLCSTLLLFRCAGLYSSKGIKNPEGLAAHRDGATERPTFQFGAALAPRCCPFPVSSTVSRLLMRHSRNAKRTIRHPGATRQTAKPKKFGRLRLGPNAACRPNFLSKFGLGRRPPRFRGILHLFGRLPRLAASLAASVD
jgi:hypothetical protein